MGVRRPHPRELAVGLLAAAALLMSACGDPGAQAEAPAPRHADAYGLVEGTLGRWADMPRDAGWPPATIQVGGVSAVVTADTEVWGSCLGMAEPTGGVPCHAQVGFQLDGRTAGWLLVLSPRPDDGGDGPELVDWIGVLQGASGDDLVFTDGSVIPGADAAVVGCPPNGAAGQLVNAAVDAASGRAVELRCGAVSTTR